MKRIGKPRSSDTSLVAEREKKKEDRKRGEEEEKPRARWTPWTGVCTEMFSRHQEQSPLPQLPSTLGFACALVPRMRALPTHQYLYQILFETWRGEISPVLAALFCHLSSSRISKTHSVGECVSNILCLPLLVSCPFLPQ